MGAEGIRTQLGVRRSTKEYEEKLSLLYFVRATLYAFRIMGVDWTDKAILEDFARQEVCSLLWFRMIHADSCLREEMLVITTLLQRDQLELQTKLLQKVQ